MSKNIYYELPPPSEEQQIIINFVLEGYNTKIESVAGAGKSTTLLHIAKSINEKYNINSLLLTYNRDLKDELLEKISTTDIQKYISIYTYHGYASKYYGKTINDDISLKNNLNLVTNYQFPYHIILLDEVQDMKDIYYEFIKKLLKPNLLVVIAGESRQLIVPHSTDKYISQCEYYFDTGRMWRHGQLRTSYRLTPAIAKFVNENILLDNIIYGGNTKSKNIKPSYYIDSFNLEQILTNLTEKYAFEDIVIMCPSVKNISKSSPVGLLLSQCQQKFKFHVNNDDNINLSLCAGKILITTFHSMKGRERKCVIINNFDSSYFKFYNKEWTDNSSLPNIIYVACTRAREKLIVIHNSNYDHFPVINLQLLYNNSLVTGKELAKYLNRLKLAKYINYQPQNNKNILRQITNMPKFWPVEKVEALADLLTIKNDYISKENNTTVDLTIAFPSYLEDVAKYYGILIPLYTEWLLMGDIHLKEIESIKFNNKVYNKYNYLLQIENKTINQWMELVVLSHAIENNYLFIVNQITNYNWVNCEYVISSSQFIIDNIQEPGLFEQYYEYNNVEGIFDFLTSNYIWEFKCTKSLTIEHILQCGAYIALYYMNTKQLLPCKLLNINTGELITITLNQPSDFWNLFCN